MDNPFNYKIPQGGFLPPTTGNMTRPSPTTSSPHSATHPSPFARGFNGNQADFDKMMSSMGNYQKMTGMEGIQYGNNGGRGFEGFGIDYGRSGQAGPSNQQSERQSSHPPSNHHGGNANATSTGTTAKRGSKACVACELSPDPAIQV